MPDLLDKWLTAIGPRAAFEGLSAATDAAVFTVDAERRVVFWSAAAERLYGYTAAEVVGEHCLKSNRCATCIRGCGLSEMRDLDSVPIELFNKSGETLGLRKSGRAFFDDAGNFLGGVEVLVPDTSVDSEVAASEEIVATGPQATDFHGLLSRDRQMQHVFDIARSVAHSDATVLVRGESGSGKELLARAIHAESPRRDGPLITINCAAFSPALLESELFGHEKGAFTGAIAAHTGVFERAHGGTLFLDEVGELPLELQAKLLRVLEHNSFTRVGGTQELRVDVRIISATHRALRKEVEAQRFRQDLMFRLRVVPIFLPPLRERREDLSLLLHAFIERHNNRGPRRVERISPQAMRRLLDYEWPGNVRELYNVVEYAFAVGKGDTLTLGELPPEFRESTRASRRGALPPSVIDSEEAAIRWALAESGGHVGRAAELLDVSRPTFWRRRKKYGLHKPQGQ